MMTVAAIMFRTTRHASLSRDVCLVEAVVKIQQQVEDNQNKNQFKMLTEGKNKHKTRMTSELIDFLVGL